MKFKYKKQVFISSCAYLGHIIFGYSGGWSTTFLSKFADNPDLVSGMTESKISFIVAICFLGAMLATIPLGVIANTYGRKATLMTGAILISISYLGLSLVKTADWMLVFRFLVGMAQGIIMQGNLVYLGEIASTEIRGIVLGTVGIFNSVGFLTAYAVGPFVSFDATNYVGLGLSLAYFAGMFYIPESPVFLIRKGREEEAKSNLLSLNRKEDAEKISEMNAEGQAVSEVKWTKLFTVKCNRRALFITATLCFLQQLSGVGFLLGYSTTIFELSGTPIPPHIATIIVGVVLVLSGIITLIYIERYGRKFILLLSTIVSCISLGVLSVYLNLHYYSYSIVKKINWLPLPMAIIHYISYSFGFGIIPGALVGEVFQLNMRSPGASAVMLVSWTSGFLVISCLGFLIFSIGIHMLFIFFSVICFLTFVFTLIFVPETKGKSLIEVQKMLGQ